MNRMIAAATIGIGFAMSGPVFTQDALTPPQIAQVAKPATVLIRALDANGRALGTGSGFFISPDGMIVTNFHVIEEATSLQIERDSGELFDNVFYVTSDPRRDTAILKIPVANAPALPLAGEDSVDIGSRIFVMGNPLGQTATFSDGMVSARRITNGVQLLQVTAPISPGSSGGPAMDHRGHVIGIATMFLEGGQNLNFLVPIHYVRPMIAMGEQPQRFTAAALPRTGGGLAEIDPRGVDSSSSFQDTPEDFIREVMASLTSQLAQIETELGSRGYRASHEPTWGMLDSREAEDTLVSLKAGQSYAVVAVCDYDCDDIDLALYDRNGQTAEVDEDESDIAVVSYRPIASGDHTIRVRMYSCEVEPCGYGIKVYVR